MVLKKKTAVKAPPVKKQVSLVVSAEDDLHMDKFIADIVKRLQPYSSRAITSSVTVDGKTWSSYDWDFDKGEPKPGAYPYGADRPRPMAPSRPSEASERRGTGKPVKVPTIAESAAKEKARKDALRRADEEAARAMGGRKRLRKTSSEPVEHVEVDLDKADSAVTQASAASAEEVKKRLRRRQ